MNIIVDKTVQAVFDKAVYLIDAQREGFAQTIVDATRNYRARTLGILATLLDAAAEAVGASPPDDPTRFDDVLELDARIVREVLPCGLAAGFLTDEDPVLANYFRGCYERALAEVRAHRAAQFEDVESPY